VRFVFTEPFSVNRVGDLPRVKSECPTMHEVSIKEKGFPKTTQISGKCVVVGRTMSPNGSKKSKNPGFLPQLSIFPLGVVWDIFMYISSVYVPNLRRVCEGEGTEKRFPLDQVK